MPKPPPLLLLFPLLILLSAVGEESGDAPPTTRGADAAARDAVVTTRDVHDNYTVEQLFAWCLQDDTCAALYHQSTLPDFELFVKILALCLDEDGVKERYDEIVADPERAAWLWAMREWALKLPVKCPANKQWVLDPHSGKGKCVCPVDKTCEEACEDEPILIAAVGLGLMFLALLLAGSFCCKDKYPPMPPQVRSSYEYSTAAGSTKPGHPNHPNVSSSIRQQSHEQQQQTPYPSAASVLQRQQMMHQHLMRQQMIQQQQTNPASSWDSLWN